MAPMTIGKIARKAGVGVETIRFYERSGLIEKPPRRDSGYRQYPEETILRLRFIKRAKGLGFTLKEIKELLLLKIEQDTTCDDIRRKAKAKIEDIEAKIETLNKMKKALANLTLNCDGHSPVSECPIIESMEDKSDDNC